MTESKKRTKKLSQLTRLIGNELNRLSRSEKYVSLFSLWAKIGGEVKSIMTEMSNARMSFRD